MGLTIAVRKLPQNMKQKNTKKHLVLGVALACLATSSAALTLGRARGAVLLGQPLSLTIAVQADGDDAAADLCFDADVYYGDIRQDASRISVVPLRQEGGSPTAVKLGVSAPVDEPIVTVYLRSSCGQKTSRKYVLLSDLASDLAPALPSEVIARVPRTLAQPAVGVVAPSGTPQTVPTGGVEPTDPKQLAPRNKKRTAPVSKPVASRPAAVPKLATAGTKARLKLSILDLVDIKDPNLKLSNELSSQPSDDPQKREAASALWRSLNTSVQDLIQEGAQQKALREDLKSLRDLTGKNQRDLQELLGRLQQAEAQRYANPLVYGLGALLLLACLALLALLFKLRRSGSDDEPWWRSDSEHQADDLDTALISRVGVAPPTAAERSTEDEDITVASPRKVVPAAATPDFSNSGLDIDLDLDNPLPAASILEAPHAVQRQELAAAVGSSGFSAPGTRRDLSHSVHASLHAINTQEMLDVRQQADFFMTLGQHEEAISLLEGSIHENEASNPLVYLDLLKVLHTLSRKPAFDHYRSEFNSIFTGRVQPYATFGQPGNSLDAYPQICGEISELWSTDAAVEFLEQCMVRRPEDAPELYFDLDAFRDLLLLHAVASRVRLNSVSDSGLLPFSAIKMAASPDVEGSSALVVSDGLSEMTIPVTLVEPQGHELAVDLDLSSADNNLIDFDASGFTVNLPKPG